jgi:NlpC/P60 family putative phage cell wall peptidase
MTASGEAERHSMTEREKIVAVAREWIGTPYRHQASLKGVGADCLGLVRGVWRQCCGAEPEAVPPYGAGWSDVSGGDVLLEAARKQMNESKLLDCQAGDVLLFRWRPHLPARHMGIASSAVTMIHAQENACVSEVHLSPWWLRHFSNVFRFPGVDA